MNTLDEENKRLLQEADQSVAELQDISLILGRIAKVAQNLDRINYATGQLLAINAGTSLNEPETMSEPLGIDITFEEFPSDLPFMQLKDRAGEVRDKGHFLLTFLKNVESSVKERNTLLRILPSIMPVNGPISSPFGLRSHPLLHGKKKHNGIDIVAPYGSTVVATADGIVTYSASNRGYGKLVTINHGNGLMTRYGHNSRLMVKKGERVHKGQKIAEVGVSGLATGPHSHYEVRLNNTPVNPELFLLKTPVYSPYAQDGFTSLKNPYTDRMTM